MVSVLFQHIPIPKKVSALLQQNSVRLIPPFVRLIPTDFEIENSVRLNTAVSKKVSALLQQSPKKCPPYYSPRFVCLSTVRLSTVPHLDHVRKALFIHQYNLMLRAAWVILTTTQSIEVV